MMKIVYLLNHIEVGGGIQKVTIVKANALAQNGHDVIIAVTNSYDNLFIFERIDPKVKIIDLGIKYKEPRYAFYNIKKFFKNKREIKNLIKKDNPDFLICLGYWDRFFLPFIKRGKTKIIREIHYVSNYKLIIHKKGLLRFLQLIKNYLEYRLVGPLWDRIVLLTEYDLNNIWIGSKKNTIAIHNPVTINAIKSNLTEKVVVSICRLVDAKNPQLLIRSFASVCQKYPDWKLRILGDGILKNELDLLIQNFGMSNNINLIGNTRQIAEELSQASIFAHSSNYEGLGLSLLEAVSCGLPVVSTETVGACEILSGQNCGFLTQLDNEEEMCDKICELIENHELMMQMQLYALKRAQDFSLSNIISEWERLFYNMME